MKRIDFIKKLSLALGSLGMVGLANKIIANEIPQDAKKIIEFHIAGYVFYDGESIERQLYSKSLKLQRECKNPHDKNAIEIFWKRFKLGYVPRQYNEIIAKMLDINIKLYAKIENVNIEMPSWKRINVGIYM